ISDQWQCWILPGPLLTILKAGRHGRVDLPAEVNGPTILKAVTEMVEKPSWFADLPLSPIWSHVSVDCERKWALRTMMKADSTFRRTRVKMDGEYRSEEHTS